MNHTPEPWVLSESHYGAIVSNASSDIRKNWCLSTSDTGRIYSNELAVANARRIVACVNACAGLSTDDLEKTGLISAVGYQLLNADKERDTYRDLCAKLLEDLRHIKLNVSSPLDAYYIATEAVKKAEAILGDKNGR